MGPDRGAESGELRLANLEMLRQQRVDHIQDPIRVLTHQNEIQVQDG